MEIRPCINYCPEHGDLLPIDDVKDYRSNRCRETHTVDEILRHRDTEGEK